MEAIGAVVEFSALVARHSTLGGFAPHRGCHMGRHILHDRRLVFTWKSAIQPPHPIRYCLLSWPGTFVTY